MLISTLSLVLSALTLFYSFSFDCAYSNLLFSIVPRITLSPSPLCNPLPPFSPFSNILLESDSIFAPAVLLWRGHISWPYPREARTRDAKAVKERGERAGWQTGITGENTGAFNMQLPSMLPEGKTSRKIGANTRASSGSRPSNSESRLMVTPGPRAGGEINFQGPWNFATRRTYKSINVAFDCVSLFMTYKELKFFFNAFYRKKFNVLEC